MVSCVCGRFPAGLRVGRSLRCPGDGPEFEWAVLFYGVVSSCFILRSQDAFQCIEAFSDDPNEYKVMWTNTADEVLIAALLVPMARVNLRAPIRMGMSVTDASEEGAGSAASTRLSEVFTVEAAERTLDINESLLINSCDVGGAKAQQCLICGVSLDSRPFLRHVKNAALGLVRSRAGQDTTNTVVSSLKIVNPVSALLGKKERFSGLQSLQDACSFQFISSASY